ncbi:MAG: phosphatidylglycerol--membrane-oligosaccharide glycerophosphotransferase, partial [Arcobacter butzleri]|nr:phosphatidylglycerol--membrane-oligosaccharide glycerophosphotransferase [Aliarcobacter butzleri]
MDSLFIFSIIFFIFSLITSKYKQKKRFRIVLDLLLMIVFTTVSIAYYISNYFTGKGINESVITTLTLGLDGAGYEEYFNLIFISFFTFLILFIMAFFYYR